jgi:Lrp/AsnC family leucine-responsive transcriptional regulator
LVKVTRFVRNEIAFLCALCLFLQSMAKNDRINQQILQELSRDGRISNLELADRVGLSPSACLRRVQDLEQAGVITGYRAVLDRDAMGVGFVTYIGVGLGEHTKEAQQAFERAMDEAPEVVECHNITGTIEYLLRVECADLSSYKRFHTDILGTSPYVTAITTYVVMGSPKDMRA